MQFVFINVVTFWFTELTNKQHFAKDAALDAFIAHRFGAALNDEF